MISTKDVWAFLPATSTLNIRLKYLRYPWLYFFFLTKCYPYKITRIKQDMHGMLSVFTTFKGCCETANICTTDWTFNKLIRVMYQQKSISFFQYLRKNREAIQITSILKLGIYSRQIEIKCVITFKMLQKFAVKGCFTFYWDSLYSRITW